MTVSNPVLPLENSFTTVEKYKAPSNYKRGDTVKMFGEAQGLSYPNLMLECEGLPSYIALTLKGIIEKEGFIKDENDYSVYINISGSIVYIGRLRPDRLKLVIRNRIFNSFKQSIMLSDKEVVEGDMLYALCITTSY